VLLCLDGCGNISVDKDGGGRSYIDIYKGDCIFVPANSNGRKISGMMEMLDIRC
jgi:mannose-6-phosphate isomerase